MTEKKKKSEQAATPGQDDKKIKATTGAWWKSSVVSEPVPKVVVQDVAGQEQVPVAEVAPEIGEQPKKVNKKPARPRRKKTEAPLEAPEPDVLPRIEERSGVEGEKVDSAPDNLQEAVASAEIGAEAGETSATQK